MFVITVYRSIEHEKKAAVHFEVDEDMLPHINSQLIARDRPSCLMFLEVDGSLQSIEWKTITRITIKEKGARGAG